MKPVVSSIVALAIAMAPLSAMAGSSEKSTHHGKAPSAKVIKKDKCDKVVDKSEEKSDKSDKADVEKAEKAEKPLVRAKHSKKPILHHATNVDLSGAGHGEPKIERGVSVIPASFKTHGSRAKKAMEKADKVEKAELPALPSPNAAKPPLRNASERSTRKPAEKKHDGDSSAKDGKPERDGELAALVARNRGGKDAAQHEKATCTKEPVEVIRGPEMEKFRLTKCDGSIAPLAIEHLSILVRPGSAPRPTTPVDELAKKKGAELAHGIRRIDPRLVGRIQAVVDHFSKRISSPKLSIISGYRPTSIGSMHSSGRAIDFRLEGVPNEEVVAFCKTLDDTGCGFYPNSSFVHIDVRNEGAGHVAWIDASGPGESPRYVSQWPLPDPARGDGEIRRPADVLEHTSAKKHEDPGPALDREATPEAVDEHPSDDSDASN